VQGFFHLSEEEERNRGGIWKYRGIKEETESDKREG
jgi:hypothetical protein